MGRSGGGGGHSSGGFSGGHSSGGFSGGGRSSGGGFSSHSSSGFSHRPSYGGGPHYHHSTFFFSPRPHYGPGYGYRRGGLGSVLAAIIVWFIIIMLIIAIASAGSSSSVPKNTKEREALSGIVKKTEWYRDDIGWISNRSVLIDGLEEFYNKTGVQPYILFVPYSAEYWNGSSINATAADQYLESVYSSTFSDEGHFIFAYFQCLNDTKKEMDGEFRYLSGYSADTIMDNEAITIFWGYFEKNYYNTSISLEKMISKTFSETANNIMSSATNGWDFAKTFFIIIGVVIIAIIIYRMIKNKQKREKEKEEHTEKILSQPLETFGKDTSDLEKKYEDD